MAQRQQQTEGRLSASGCLASWPISIHPALLRPFLTHQGDDLQVGAAETAQVAGLPSVGDHVLHGRLGRLLDNHLGRHHVLDQRLRGLVHHLRVDLGKCRGLSIH